MNDTEHHPDAVEARQALEHLSRLVYEAIEYGIEHAKEYFGDEPADPWLFPHIVRHRALTRLRLDGSFSIVQNPMSGIEIDWGRYNIRVFKKCGEEEFLYPPGHSQGRQDFYDQQQLVLPGVAHLIVQGLNVAYVWEPTADGLELWLVCPDGFDGIWKPGKAKWTIRIPHPADSMVPEHGFGADDEDDLPLQLDEVGTGSDDEA